MRYAIFLLLTCSILLEGTLQLKYRLQNEAWLSKSFFRVPTAITIPVSDRRSYSLRPNYRDGRISINSLGFRGKPVAREEKKLIVVIGDSVPFGWGVKDEETYPYYLEQLLGQNGLQYRVLNAGVPSYNIRQSIDRLRIEVLPNYPKPALVILQASNDLSLLSRYRTRLSSDTNWYDRDPPWRKVISYSALHHYVQRSLTRIIASDSTTIEHFKKHLALLSNEVVTYFRANKVPILLLPSDPYFYQTMNLDKNQHMRGRRVTAQNSSSALNVYNESIKSLADSKDIYFLDTREILDKLEREKLYVDVIHYSPLGNQTVARSIYEYLVKHDIGGVRLGPPRKSESR